MSDLKSEAKLDLCSFEAAVGSEITKRLQREKIRETVIAASPRGNFLLVERRPLFEKTHRGIQVFVVLPNTWQRSNGRNVSERGGRVQCGRRERGDGRLSQAGVRLRAFGIL